MREYRILLVDDNLGFLDSAESFLRAHPELEVVGRALSGLEAIEQVAALHPDMVLMDLVMPGMDGLEATRRIKSKPHPPHVVLVTLHDDAEYHAAAKEAQADAFLAKSEIGLRLLPLIRHLLAG
jgi:DNA-binding NarL/FixJ family response regulator